MDDDVISNDKALILPATENSLTRFSKAPAFANPVLEGNLACPHQVTLNYFKQ